MSIQWEYSKLIKSDSEDNYNVISNKDHVNTEYWSNEAFPSQEITF